MVPGSQGFQKRSVELVKERDLKEPYVTLLNLKDHITIKDHSVIKIYIDHLCITEN